MRSINLKEMKKGKLFKGMSDEEYNKTLHEALNMKLESMGITDEETIKKFNDELDKKLR